MKQWNGYEQVKPYTENKKLPAGGYVLTVCDVEEAAGANGSSDVLVIYFDIVEGEHAGFYQHNYDAQKQEDKKWKGTYRLYVPKDDGSEQDSWTKRKFKTVMQAFEESNDQFYWEWDEQKLKGLQIGALFNHKEYLLENGRHGFYTNCHSLVTVEKIRSGEFEIPPDTLLKKEKKQGSGYGKADVDGFLAIPDGMDEELPFQ